MKEKNTKKMTRAEAFEWLKCKKVNAMLCQSAIQEKLFDIGNTWVDGSTKVVELGVRYYIDENGKFSFGGDEEYFRLHCYEEVQARDILSLEIEEECAKDDEDPYFGGRIKDLQEMIEDDEILIITKTNFLTMTK